MSYVFVDKLRIYHNAWGPFLKGSCHMFAFLHHTDALHDMSRRIGMRREWFQDCTRGGHYDLTASKRAMAVKYGAIELGDREAITVWRQNRAIITGVK